MVDRRIVQGLATASVLVPQGSVLEGVSMLLLVSFRCSFQEFFALFQSSHCLTVRHRRVCGRCKVDETDAVWPC